ncbi:MAG: NAD(P)/FAD-dependent oxidoreductase [Candidatus Sumerlaeaceae bacterium]
METTRLHRAKVRNVIIIGSGPAGLTAALYTARANLKPLVLEGDGFEHTTPGGQLMMTSEVENYPGMYKFRLGTDGGGNARADIDEFLTGPQMMAIMRAQAQHFGAECHPKRVTAVDFACRPLRVEVDEEKYYSESVIISTGATAKWLGIPSEEEYKNLGVTACATCDGALFKGKDVLVVGGGDTAMEEATYLTRHCKTVTIVHRRDEFRASRIMLDRAKANTEQIKWLLNSQIVEVFGKQDGMRKFMTGVRVKDTVTGDEREVPADGLFMAIGHKPNTDIFEGQLDMDDLGYIRTRGRSTLCNKTDGEMLPGVFACGDCQDHVYRQAVTAAGTGCMAAIDSERFITSNPILYGIEQADSPSYMNLMAAAQEKADDMPVKEPTMF